MHRSSLFIVLLTVLAVTAGAATNTIVIKPKADDILPFEATEATLDNGLKLIVVPTGFPNIVSLQIPVLTGSRNEVEKGKSGFAHFFEHMMFRGTEKYSPEEYNRIITKAGARQNAYTTDDYTNYHITFAKEDLEKMLEIEADRFQNLSYPVEAFKTESRAVLGEYNKNSANPISKLYEVSRATAFTTHTYRHTTMGFIEDIEDMPNQYEYSKTFFQRWYRPANTAVIVAGDVDPAKVLPLVEKYWGKWEKGTPADVKIPREPEPKGPKYAHVPWETKTAPWVQVAFHGPAFSETGKDAVAIQLFMDMNFGRTSDFYRRMVEQEQKVDQMFSGGSNNKDPELITIWCRLKNVDDVEYVRDEILKTVATAKATPVDAKRLEDAKSNNRYGFAAGLDNTDTIAARLARFVRYDRSYATLNNAFRAGMAVTPDDVATAANKYFTDNRLVVTTLSTEALPESVAAIPSLSSFAPSAAAMLPDSRFIIQKTALPQLRIKLLFDVGSAHDPAGKEGLAALAADMITEAGSKALRIDEINKALFPIAGGFGSQVDKEMTTLTMSVHRDNWNAFSSVVVPQLLAPGFREEDFTRIKSNQMSALTLNLRSNNEEELGKEVLQNRIFAGTPYGHTVLGTVAGIESITIDDVRDFVAKHYTQENLKVGIIGAISDDVLASVKTELAKLPQGDTPRPTSVVGKMPKGLEVEILKKETRATAISFGHPIDVNRAHPDFPALSVARAWLGEHRSSMSHLYDRIRETRGMNYGDYAYIEAFPRGMFQFFPDPNIARQKQIFEVWIRPVVPDNAHMALRIALHEVGKLVENGLTNEQFEASRGYLMKNVYVTTANANQQIGYALDSDWYGIGEYTSTMRERLAKLTVADVNAAVRKHVRPSDFKVIMITRDADDLKRKLESNMPSVMQYEADKPQSLLDEDKVIGALKLDISKVEITPIDEVFAK
jgi:zinc protease